MIVPNSYVTPQPPTPTHNSAVTWIDILIADVRARLLNKPPSMPITAERLHYWLSLCAKLEECKDDTTSKRFVNLGPEHLVSRHWEALRWANGLIIDLKLELTPIKPVNEVTLARLDEWQTHRADLLACQPVNPPTWRR